ncbi:MAG: hypothetical protein WAV47_15645, partial [Blastocatellia bacterium]
MADLIAKYLSQLEPDEWRYTAAFSPEVEAANERLFAQETTETESAEVIGNWLQVFQPCLFGRIAAKHGAISYCILNEDDLRKSDEAIRDRIQAARLAWTRDGFEGRKSGFIILAVSPLIACAKPSPIMRELARRLCYLYLESEITMDHVHLDEIYLQKPGSRLTTWKWHTGVNYFCAQGDGRWWQDHRIPGGIAFSVNSVGHLVKSGMIANAMKDLEALTGAPDEGYPLAKIDSLEKALELAMRTIGMASETVSGRATELLPLGADRNELPVAECPVKLSKLLAGKNYCEYSGWYHTDYTLPSEYFLPDIERTADLKVHSLDFTYLFHGSIDNPDFRVMGEGHQIRQWDSKSRPAETLFELSKVMKGDESEVLFEMQERLVKAMA